jgi:5-hydroxyisourate hydrolase
MTRITTHVLDTGTGIPASGLAVRLERLEGPRADAVAEAVTDADGRIRDWLPGGVPGGRYRLVFETGTWFRRAGRESIYPEIVIHFSADDSVPHYHLPLLLAPYGYSTYRGS